MRSWVAGSITLVALAAFAAGCGGSIVDPANNQTETFTGTLAAGGAAANAFNVSKSGEYSVTLVSLSPAAPSNVFFTVFLGQNSTSGCVPITGQANAFAQAGKVVLNSSIVPAQYCVGIVDANRVVATSVIYTFQVQHP